METVVRVRKVCSVEACSGHSNQSFKIFFNRAVMAQSRLMVFYARQIAMHASRIVCGWTYSNRCSSGCVLCLVSGCEDVWMADSSGHLSQASQQKFIPIFNGFKLFSGSFARFNLCDFIFSFVSDSIPQIREIFPKTRLHVQYEVFTFVHAKTSFSK